MPANGGQLHIGGLLFDQIDQADFTGPFEVLSRVPDSTFHVIAKNRHPVKDARGLILTPGTTFAECPPLDVLHIPGGGGVNAVMEDAETLDFLRRQAAGARIIFSVCTGALLCGAAGLLKGRRATTHWASHSFLEMLGAIPVDERVVVDGSLVSAAGVTAGLDGALRVAAMLRGEQAAQEIQLYMQYAPEPPFNSGSPETAPAAVLKATQASLEKMQAERREVIDRVKATLT